LADRGIRFDPVTTTVTIQNVFNRDSGRNMGEKQLSSAYKANTSYILIPRDMQLDL